MNKQEMLKKFMQQVGQQPCALGALLMHTPMHTPAPARTHSIPSWISARPSSAEYTAGLQSPAAACLLSQGAVCN